MQNFTGSNDAYAALRAGQFQPYAQLAVTLQGQLSDGVRFVPLRQGERLTTLGGTQISVLSGKARLSSTGCTLTDNATRAMPFLVSQRGDILQALEDTALILADRDFLDLIASWQELVRHAQETGSAVAERLTQLRRAMPFRRLPLECVEAAFAHMTPLRVLAGAEIVRQGAPGDVFYTLWRGRAEVWQQGFNDQAPHKIADLQAGDSFGEEALGKGNSSQTSVRMASDGELLVLPRAKYLELIERTQLQDLSPVEAKNRLESGWVALDLRHIENYQEGRVADALPIPLEHLRERAEASLSRATPYIAMCHSGQRSAVAALLLAQWGYQVANLKNGMREANFDLVKGHSPHNEAAA